jgi:hypothetical protein
MCRKEQYQCPSDDGVFWMNTIRSYQVAKVFLDEHSFSFKLHELRTLMYTFFMIRHQMIMYTGALCEFRAYVNAAMAWDSYKNPLQPHLHMSFPANYSRSSNYPSNTLLFNKRDRSTVRLLFLRPFSLYYPTLTYVILYIRI